MTPPDSPERILAAHAGTVESSGGDHARTGQDGAFPILSPLDIADVPPPPRQWLVEGIIPLKAVTLFAGDGGTGKSLLALQLACSVAYGAPWLGFETLSGPALVVAAEDDRDEIHRRLHAIARVQETPLCEMPGLRILLASGLNAALFSADEWASQGQWSHRLGEVECHAREIGARLIVLDTSADLFAGNENARRQVRQFMAGLSALGSNLDAAVILLSHPSASGMATGRAYSGSTAWNGSARARLSLTVAREEGYSAPDPGNRVLSLEKGNYGPTGQAIRLRFNGGAFVPVDGPDRLDRVARASQVRRLFLEGLRELDRQGRVDTASDRQGKNYGPKLVRELPGNGGFTVKEFATAMAELLKEGLLFVDHIGSPSRVKPVLRIVGALPQ